jgi:hypothetical protein
MCSTPLASGADGERRNPYVLFRPYAGVTRIRF